MTVATVMIHATAGFSTSRIAQLRRNLGRAGVRMGEDVVTIMAAVGLFMCAHLLEMALWAFLLMGIGEFHGFAAAFYPSATNYTTLGYGDIVMSAHWRMLGPLEATNGMLMFGLSTAILFALIIRLAELRQGGKGIFG